MLANEVRDFTFASRKGKSCAIVSHNDTMATVVELFLYGNFSAVSICEYDIKLDELEPLDYVISEQSMLYRLMESRKKNGNLHNFFDEEFSLIHSFNS